MRKTVEKSRPSLSSGKSVAPVGARYYGNSIKSWPPEDERENELGSFDFSWTSTPDPGITWYPRADVIKYVNTTYPKIRRRKRRKDETYADYIRFLKSFHRHGKRRFEPCIHARRQTECDPSVMRFVRTTYRPQLGHGTVVYNREVFDAKFGAPVGGISTSTTIGDWWLGGDQDLIKQKLVELKQMSLDAMIPSMGHGWSLPLFLVELFDLKLLVKSAEELLFSSGRAWRRLLNRPLKELSSRTLETSFGVLPVVRDVKKMVEIFRSIDDETFDLLANEGTRRTLHFRKALSPYTFRPMEDFESESVFYDTGTIANTCSAIGDPNFQFITLNGTSRHSIDVARFHASLDFSYSLPKISAGLKQFLAEMDEWGINLDWKAIWDHIPFTFVLDWFIGVGNWLETFNFKALPVTLKVNDYCWSLSFQHTLEHVLTDMSPAEWTLPVSGRSLKQTTDLYYRFPDFPDITPHHHLGVHLPHGFTLVLGAALLGSRTNALNGVDSLIQSVVR